MANVIKLRKGLDINLKGRAIKKKVECQRIINILVKHYVLELIQLINLL